MLSESEMRAFVVTLLCELELKMEGDVTVTVNGRECQEDMDAAAERCVDMLWEQVRALVFALCQKDIGLMDDHADASEVLRLIGVPFVDEGGEYDLPDAWLLEHGFVENDQGMWRHPRFDGFGVPTPAPPEDARPVPSVGQA